MKPTISDAIVSLGFSGGFKIKENKIAVWYRDDTQPTQSTIDTKLASMISDWEDLEYARNRQSEYPDWGTQLEKIDDDGLTRWREEMIDPIKSKWPKDNSGPA